MSEADAIAVNAVAARWDGIERIASDGTVTYTVEASEEIKRTLGLALERITLGEHSAVADELAARLSRSSTARCVHRSAWGQGNFSSARGAPIAL